MYTWDINGYFIYNSSTHLYYAHLYLLLNIFLYSLKYSAPEKYHIIINLLVKLKIAFYY